MEAKKCCNKDVCIVEVQPTIIDKKNCFTKIKIFYPLILSLGYITTGSIITEYPFDSFDRITFCSRFMGLFLILFSYIKLLNPRGFVNTFAKYDIITRKCKIYGYVYPFIEGTLGIFYVINYEPIVTNSVVIGVLSLNLGQVIHAIVNKKELECACMGSLGFKLPLSYVTITEDLIMITMAIIMLTFN
jgi:hypothetical protein